MVGSSMIAGQISLFDEEVPHVETEQSPCFNQRTRCYSCVMYESHRCRNTSTCPDGFVYVEYTGSRVRQCIGATVEIFQDGYMYCPVINCYTCEGCMERFSENEFVFDERQNYDRKPKSAERQCTINNEKGCWKQ